MTSFTLANMTGRILRATGETAPELIGRSAAIPVKLCVDLYVGSGGPDERRIRAPITAGSRPHRYFTSLFRLWPRLLR